MDRLTARLLTPMALQGWRLAWWAAAFGAGVYAGYKIAFYPGDSSGWGVVGVLFAGAFWVGWTVAFLAILALVAAFLYRTLFKGRLPQARTVIAAAALYAAGVGVGFVLTPVLGLEYQYREPVALEGRGTITLSLEGVAGYAARNDVLATCESEMDGEGVYSVSAAAVGTIDGVEVNASIGIELEAAYVGVSLPTANSKFLTWSGPGDFVERSPDGRDARVTFAGAAPASGVGDPVRGDWPATLSGTVTWSCGEWIGPVVTPGPGPSS